MTARVYIRLGRISNLPTVWSNVLAGVTLADGAIRGASVLTLMLAMSLFYVGGMYLNDAFDRHIDARERPERPIPSGLISARRVFGLGYGMCAAGVVILVLDAVRAPGAAAGAATSAVGLVATITYYDMHHKQNPLSPFVMGICRMLVYVAAAVTTTGRLPRPVIGGALVLFCYLIGLTYVAKQETLSRYRNVWPLAFLFVPLIYSAPALPAGVTVTLLWIALLGWIGYAIWFLIRPGRHDIPAAVISFIAGISLLDALLIAGHGRPATAWVAAAGWPLTLFFQRYVRGT